MYPLFLLLGKSLDKAHTAGPNLSSLKEMVLSIRSDSKSAMSSLISSSCISLELKIDCCHIGVERKNTNFLGKICK